MLVQSPPPPSTVASMVMLASRAELIVAMARVSVWQGVLLPMPQHGTSFPVTASTGRTPPSNPEQQALVPLPTAAAQIKPEPHWLLSVQLVKQAVVSQTNGAQGTVSGVQAPDPLQALVGPLWTPFLQDSAGPLQVVVLWG